MSPVQPSREATRLVLVRHGEAEVNLNGVLGGERGCTGLTDRGREQARVLGERLLRTGEVAADVVYTSVLRRAVETAEILAPAVGCDPADVVKDCDVCEIHLGEADGMTFEDLQRSFGFVPWWVDTQRKLAPGGESWSEFMERVGRLLQRLAEAHLGETVLVVAHGGVVDGSMLNLLGLPTSVWPAVDFPTRNASLTEWEWHRKEGDAPEGRWRLIRYNDVAHFAGTDF